jgi:hypothetical protein
MVDSKRLMLRHVGLYWPLVLSRTERKVRGNLTDVRYQAIIVDAFAFDSPIHRFDLWTPIKR